jgi:hypothetical protein
MIKQILFVDWSPLQNKLFLKQNAVMTFLSVRSGTDRPGSWIALLLNFSYREISDMLTHIGYVDVQQ